MEQPFAPAPFELELEQSPLDSIILAYPCKVQWSSMEGDERERFCNKCSLTVFNISDLTKKEAEDFLRSKSDDNLCLKFYHRADGTIKTDNCPRYLRSIRNRIRWLHKTTSLSLAFLLSLIGTALTQAHASDAYKKDDGKSFGANTYKLDPNENPSLMLGVSCGPTSPVRLLMMEVLHQTGTVRWGRGKHALYNKGPDVTRPDEVLLFAIYQRMIKDRALDLNKLEELKKVYLDNDSTLVEAFKVMELELLIKLKAPSQHQDLTESLTEFEEFRQKELNELAIKAETAIAQKNYDDAKKLVDLWRLFSTRGWNFASGIISHPTGVKQIRVQHYVFITTNSNFDRIMKILAAMDPHIKCSLSWLLTAERKQQG